jgi:hypothetical protein
MSYENSWPIVTEKSLVEDFFKFSQGRWQSERRYYTLPNGITQEIFSLITVKFLEAGCPELTTLAELHQVNTEMITCGSLVSWSSKDAHSGRDISEGDTIFGAGEGLLYRDRGHTIRQPVCATYYLPNPETLCLRTENNGSIFEEEIKHIGQKYRTRQTIISRAGEQMMIGQYLEKRIN